MEICTKSLGDNSKLLTDIAAQNLPQGSMFCVDINLPDYVDTTSLLAMKRRMVQTAEQSCMLLRLLGKTTNLEVEKFASRLFADRNDIYITIAWRATDG